MDSHGSGTVVLHKLSQSDIERISALEKVIQILKQEIEELKRNAAYTHASQNAMKMSL